MACDRCDPRFLSETELTGKGNNVSLKLLLRHFDKSVKKQRNRSRVKRFRGLGVPKI